MSIRIFEKSGAIIVTEVTDTIKNGNDKIDAWMVKDPRVVQAFFDQGKDGKRKLQINLLPLVYLALLKEPEEGFKVRYDATQYQDVTDQFNEYIVKLYAGEIGAEKKPEEKVEEGKITNITS